MCNFSKKMIDIIDLSNNHLVTVAVFFECHATKELYLKGNHFEYVDRFWNFLINL